MEGNFAKNHFMQKINKKSFYTNLDEKITKKNSTLFDCVQYYIKTTIRHSGRLVTRYQNSLLHSEHDIIFLNAVVLFIYGLINLHITFLDKRRLTFRIIYRLLKRDANNVFLRSFLSESQFINFIFYSIIIIIIINCLSITNGVGCTSSKLSSTTFKYISFHSALIKKKRTKICLTTSIHCNPPRFTPIRPFAHQNLPDYHIPSLLGSPPFSVLLNFGVPIAAGVSSNSAVFPLHITVPTVISALISTLRNMFLLVIVITLFIYL